MLSRVLQSRGKDGFARIDCELVHYKPFDRAVLKVRETVRDPAASPRTVYAKFFAGDELESFREYEELWSATRRATHLRLPEPLAYDPALRMLLMSEATGGHGLKEWIKCIEGRKPLYQISVSLTLFASEVAPEISTSCRLALATPCSS